MVMRLTYITTYDVLNSSSWKKGSVGQFGAGYHLAKSLENQDILLDYIGPLEEKIPLISRFKWHFYRRLMNKNYSIMAEPLVLKEYASQISRKLLSSNSDIALCPENYVPIAYLECKQPLVLWTDAPLAASIDFYPWWSNLCDETKRNIYAIEKAALDRCKLVIFLSEWAAQMAIKTYGIEPSKVKVIPWGANIECNRTIDDINTLAESRPSNLCKLLFIGVDWFRKGGDTALEVAKELKNMGINTELVVVGCQPVSTEPLPNFVKNIKFIDKYTEEGQNQMNSLFSESHFLILPTRADFSPHVLGEANSFGLPCLTTDVGGIPTIIKDNLNGKTFPLNASVSEYCNYIASVMANYGEYKKLALSSFQEYQSRLNWAVAAQTAKKLLMEKV